MHLGINSFFIIDEKVFPDRDLLEIISLSKFKYQSILIAMKDKTDDKRVRHSKTDGHCQSVDQNCSQIQPQNK